MNHSSKITIGGIKFSEELIHISVPHELSAGSAVGVLVKRLAQQKITIPFLCSSRSTRGSTTSFCIAGSDLHPLKTILAERFFADLGAELLPSVGLCTVFPHRNSLNFLGKIVEILGLSGFPLYSFSTSISALAFTTDFDVLDTLAEELISVFSLPENHAPFRQEFQVKQLPH